MLQILFVPLQTEMVNALCLTKRQLLYTVTHTAVLYVRGQERKGYIQIRVKVTFITEKKNSLFLPG